VAMHTEACEAATVREEQSPQVLDLRMACLHRAAVDLDATVEVLADADEETVKRAYDLTGSLRSLARCADTDALAAEVEPPEPAEAEAVEQARARLAEAKSLTTAGRYQEGKRAIEEAEALLDGVQYGPVWTEMLLAHGMALEDLGDYESSEETLQDALRRAARWRQWDAMREAAAHLLYVAGHKLRRLDHALGYRRVAEGLSRGSPGAEALFLNNLAIVLRAQGKFAEAEENHRAALALWEASLGPDHPTIAESRNNLATALSDQGKYQEAETEHRAALALWQASLGPNHPKVAEARNNLATALADQDKDAEAETEIRAALTLWEGSLGPDHPYVATARTNLATILHGRGKYAEAEKEYRAARASWEVSLGPDHPNVATSHNNLGNVFRDQGRYAAAETEYRAALKLYKAALGPDHFIVAASRRNLAEALLALHRADQALPVAEQAWARGQGDDVPPKWRAKIAFTLARCLRTTEDRDRARQLAEDALASLEKAEHVSTEQVGEVKRWLGEHPSVRRP
jgi:tetratricopeptide (TPR) repeat protein